MSVHGAQVTEAMALRFDELESRFPNATLTPVGSSDAGTLVLEINDEPHGHVAHAFLFTDGELEMIE